MINTLTQLGLNNNQAQARLAVWQYGLSPASHIAKIINKERTHAYKLLSQLHDDGLVEISMRGKTRYFYVPDKSVLQGLIHRQQTKLQTNKKALSTLENQLDSLVDPAHSLVPPIQQWTGVDGVNQGLHDCINICQGNNISQISIFGSKTLESIATSTHTLGEKRSDFFDELTTHHIHIQGYEGTGILLLEHISQGLSSYDIQTLPTGSHALQVIIAGSHIYYLFARREPVMIKISSPEMAELLRVLLTKSTA